MEGEAARTILYASILLDTTHCIKATSFWLASLNNIHNMTMKLKKEITICNEDYRIAFETFIYSCHGFKVERE